MRRRFGWYRPEVVAPSHSDAKSFNVLRRKVRADAEHRRRVGERKRAILASLALAEAGKARNLTQEELAKILAATQVNVPRIERQEDVYLSSLRKYVEALSGQLAIAAILPEQTLNLMPTLVW